MRIADLLVDVKLLMQTDAGAAVLSDGFPSAPFVTENSETASVSVAETEDDPVNLAMRTGLMEAPSVEDDADEVIMWERTTPIVEQSARFPPPTTAQDLLQNLSRSAGCRRRIPRRCSSAATRAGGAQRAQRVHAAVPWQSENQQGHRLSNPAIFEFAQPQAPQPQAPQQQAPQPQGQQYSQYGAQYYQQYGAPPPSTAHPSSAWTAPAQQGQGQSGHSQPLYASQSGQSGQRSAQHSAQHSNPHSDQPTPQSGQHSHPHSTEPSPPAWRPRPAAQTQVQNIWGPPDAGAWGNGQRTASSSSAGWGYRPG
ncbi:hypothetical protein CcaverHIS002_0205780 [Cutaneotrichosporon cavernicola]|nr:hypothetical protein CcaverHIS002_0205780 [Cutaneotrichosporon cavernicola]